MTEHVAIAFNTFDLDKKELMQQARHKMNRSLTTPTMSIKDKIVATCHILFSNGHDSGLSGQISARSDVQGAYYTQRFGLGFNEVNVDNLLLVDENLNVLEGQGMPNPANRFHSWIYKTRPDVQCIVHTHPTNISALSMVGKRIIVSHMDSCILLDEIAYLDSWPGVPVGNNEGEIISITLGLKRIIVLAHHGLLVACGSIEEACVMAFQCEKTAALQILASSMGNIRNIESGLAIEAHDWLLEPSRVSATFHYLARKIGVSGLKHI